MISSFAQVHPSSKIGNNVIIDAFAVIDDNVVIGDNTHVMSHAVVLKGTIIGNSCLIFPGAVIGAIPQDLKFVGEETTVEIGDHTTIRECVTINRGTKDKWKTVVGEHCLLMAYTHIAHDCILGNHVILANGVQLAGHVEVNDYAIIGGTTGVTQFVKIGAHAYIAAHTIVTKDVPPYIKTSRVPFCYAGVNSVGLQRRGFTSEKINDILEIYRHIYTKGLNISQAMELIENKFHSFTEKDEILNFIKNSNRGIIKASAKENNNED
jgi:UDP-N-acetylglucosamine acyltransferase